MPIIYNGSHSVEIIADGVTYNTWSDWHLVPASRPFVNRPEANFNIVQLPGTSRFVDLTQYQPGGLTFGQRTGEWDFIIDHDRWPSWVSALESITAALHGKPVEVRLVDDPARRYTGRMQVKGYKEDNEYSTITFSYIFQSGYTDSSLDPIDDPSDNPGGGVDPYDPGGGGGGGGGSSYFPTPSGYTLLKSGSVGQDATYNSILRDTLCGPLQVYDWTVRELNLKVYATSPYWDFSYSNSQDFNGRSLSDLNSVTGGYYAQELDLDTGSVYTSGGQIYMRFDTSQYIGSNSLEGNYAIYYKYTEYNSGGDTPTPTPTDEWTLYQSGSSSAYTNYSFSFKQDEYLIGSGSDTKYGPLSNNNKTISIKVVYSNSNWLLQISGQTTFRESNAVEYDMKSSGTYTGTFILESSELSSFDTIYMRFVIKKTDTNTSGDNSSGTFSIYYKY